MLHLIDCKILIHLQLHLGLFHAMLNAAMFFLVVEWLNWLHIGSVHECNSESEVSKV